MAVRLGLLRHSGNSDIRSGAMELAWPEPGRAAPRTSIGIRLFPLDKRTACPSDGTAKEGSGLANTSAEEQEELRI